jgi:hypothetical protein
MELATPPATPAKPRRAWLWIALAVSLVVVLGFGAYLALGRTSGPTLDGALKACNGGRPGTQLADGGKTLIVDMMGTTQMLAGKGGVDAATEACILSYLKAPAAVVEHMDSTRALDGRQEDAWGDFKAAWTYHPDDGLDITIQQK